MSHKFVLNWATNSNYWIRAEWSWIEPWFQTINSSRTPLVLSSVRIKKWAKLSSVWILIKRITELNPVEPLCLTIREISFEVFTITFNLDVTYMVPKQWSNCGAAIKVLIASSGKKKKKERKKTLGKIDLLKSFGFGEFIENFMLTDVIAIWNGLIMKSTLPIYIAWTIWVLNK